MRILMLTTIFPPAIGGPATQCFNLCKALLQKGVTPIVVTYGDQFTKSSPNGYPVYTFRRRYYCGPFDRIIRWGVFPWYIGVLLRKEKIDVLHCHSVNMLSFTAALVAKIMKIPRVVKFAGDWVWETLSRHEVLGEDYRDVYRRSYYSRILTVIEKKGLRLFNCVWTPSHFREENVKFLLGEKAPTVIIPNSLLFNDSDQRPKKNSKEVVVVSANRFIPHKRIPMLVEAFANATDGAARLVLIGGGEKEQIRAVEETILKYKLQDSVRLTGILSTKAVYAVFRDASFYVSTSLEEGLPNVFVEAMHYGLPIVATDVGGCREMVVEGETGFLVPPHDREALQKKISLLIHDSALRNRMSDAARERARLFDLNQRIGDFLRMYRELMETK